MKAESFKYKRFNVRVTSKANPETYDVYKGTEVVAKLFLQHGRFAGYQTINHNEPFHETRTQGDGTFAEGERYAKITACIEVLDHLLTKQARAKVRK